MIDLSITIRALRRIPPGAALGLALFAVILAILPAAAQDASPGTAHRIARHKPMQPHMRGDGTMARDARHVAQSDNWAGYVLSSYQTGQSYSAMQGAWTVPTVSSSYASNARTWEYSSSWIGIGGSCEDSACANTDSSLIQIGTEQDIYSDDTSTDYYAWYELLPADQVVIPYTVQPGDAITASITCGASCSAATQSWTMTMTDATAGWTYSKTVSYAASELSAEWIEEATSTCGRRNCTIAPLPDFGQISFNQSTVNGVTPNFSIAADGLQLTDSDGQTGNLSDSPGGNAFTACWGTAAFTPCTFTAGASPLLAAVLPGSRSIQTTGSATAFATLINSGSTAATGCGITLGSNISASLTFQASNAATNAAIGTANAPVSIPAGGAQSFVIALAPGGTISPTNIGLLFGCDNANPAPVVTGVDTLLLSASTFATADIVTLAATANSDGIMHIAGSAGAGAFAVATVNLGAAAAVTARPTSTGTTTLPLSLTICQTVPATGQCMATPAAFVQTTIAADATPTFAIFGAASGTIAFAPQTSRVFVQFTDNSGAIRGGTSVAVETQ
jgi:hypothetical protein